MTEREQLLAAICANPEEDTPRLAFADWLDERGTDEDATRAAFIRAQIKLDPVPRYHPDWLPEAHKILRAWGGKLRQWRDELPRPPGVHWGEFRRGFVETVGVTSPGNLIQKGARIAASIPLLGVALNGREDLPALARSTLFSRIRRLQVAARRTLNDSALRTLLELPNFPRLTHLNLSLEQIGQDGAVAIARCPQLADLRELNLYENRIDDLGLVVLVRSPHLTKLRHLELSRNFGIRESGVRELADSPVPAGLEELYLDPCGGSEGAWALAESKYLTRLAVLALQDHTLGPTGAQAVAGSPNFAGLMVLRIRGALGPHAAQAVAESPHLRSLRELSLGFNGIGDAGAVALANSPNMRSLRRLNLSGNGLTDAGARALAESPHLAGLCEGGFFLGINQGVTRAGIDALIERFGNDPTQPWSPGGLPGIQENVRF